MKATARGSSNSNGRDGSVAARHSGNVTMTFAFLTVLRFYGRCWLLPMGGGRRGGCEVVKGTVGYRVNAMLAKPVEAH
jgi:hypothetical protein